MPREEGLGSLNIYTILTYGGFLARQHFPSNDDSKFSIRSLTRRPLSLSLSLTLPYTLLEPHLSKA